jgi:hypothetical protein
MSPYREPDDELLVALRARGVALLEGANPPRTTCPPASPEDIAETESQIGFPLPSLLRRVYETVINGIGPGYGLLIIGQGEGTLAAEYRTRADWTYVPEPGEPGNEQYPWPERLLPICNWGCAIWSCLDCRSPDGPIVTASGEEPFANTGHTLRSWLWAWLAGDDLFEQMFEPGPTRMGTNPFTKKPIVIRGQGKPRGERWQ